MKLGGQNFQPWPSFELDIEGLTIIIGPSNKGKSSIYRALRGLLRNELEPGYIRDPKDQPLDICVDIGGYNIRASRSKKGSVHYFVNHPDFDKPKEYAKLDGALPPEVTALKLGEIQIADFTFDPIFASQNRPQFLIDNDAFKPSEVNAILGAFGGTEKLEAGKKQANLQKTQKDGEARVLAGQIRTAEERKAKLEIMSTRAHTATEGLAAVETAVNLLESKTSWLTHTASVLRRLEPLHLIAEALVPPDVSGLEQLQSLGVNAATAAFASKFAQWMNKPLKSVEIATNEWNAVAGAWKQIKALIDTVGLLVDQTDTSELANFKPELSLSELNALQDSISLLERTIVLRIEIKETAVRAAATEDELSAAQSVLASTQKALHDAELEAQRQRVEELTSKGLCPTCGESLEHLCQ